MKETAVRYTQTVTVHIIEQPPVECCLGQDSSFNIYKHNDYTLITNTEKGDLQDKDQKFLPSNSDSFFQTRNSLRKDKESLRRLNIVSWIKGNSRKSLSTIKISFTNENNKISYQRPILVQSQHSYLYYTTKLKYKIM